MLNDATCFKTVYIVCGYTDLRSGMDRLAALIEAQTGNKPYVPDTLYLFCGRRSDRIKGWGCCAKKAASAPAMMKKTE